MNTICLVIDRLHLGYLGPYGNAWIRTPALNRLAAEGFTFDAAFMESPQVEQFCEACWLGRHAAAPPGQIDLGRGLPALLAGRSVNTRLITDDPIVAAHPLAASFAEIVVLDLAQPDRPASSVEETLLAQCFAQVLESLGSVQRPFFQWCHLRAFGAAWDAPSELRRIDWGETDPEPPQTVTVPSTRLAACFDPDDVLGFTQVYAAQICVLDACMEVLLDWLRTHPIGRETLLVFVSPRGFPLGEHLRVGDVDEALYGELVHLPWMVRFPDFLGASDRSQALVQPSDLARTVAEWHGLPGLEITGGEGLIPVIRGDRVDVRQCVEVVGRNSELALITPAWYLRQAERPELFLRPDDRWCANDVADRCAEIVEALVKTLSEHHQASQLSQIDKFPPLPPELLSGPP